MKKVAFFGATGMLGKPVVREFLKRNYQVTALVRNIEKAQDVLPEKIEWVVGDLNEPEKVEETIKGADIVYTNLSVHQESKENDFQPEREGISTILKYAKWNNVSRIGYLSSIVKFYEGMNDFHWWAFQIKHEAIEKIKRSGIPYVIFNPSTFMENFSEGAYFKDNKMLVVGTSHHPNWIIAGEDYAKMAVNAFELVTEDENKEYIIQGPEGFTLNQAAKVFIDNYSPTQIKTNNFPLFLLKFMGMFHSKINYGAKISEALNYYPETFASEEVWKELGKPTITLAEFAKRRYDKVTLLEQETKN